MEGERSEMETRERGRRDLRWERYQRTERGRRKDQKTIKDTKSSKGKIKYRQIKEFLFCWTPKSSENKKNRINTTKRDRQTPHLATSISAPELPLLSGLILRAFEIASTTHALSLTTKNRHNTDIILSSDSIRIRCPSRACLHAPFATTSSEWWWRKDGGRCRKWRIRLRELQSSV